MLAVSLDQEIFPTKKPRLYFRSIFLTLFKLFLTLCRTTETLERFLKLTSPGNISRSLCMSLLFERFLAVYLHSIIVFIPLDDCKYALRERSLIRYPRRRAVQAVR